MSVWLCLVVACGALAPAAAVVGGDPAAPPEPDAAVVFVQKHGLSARLEGIKDDRLGYYSFFGVRYAEPPLGPRRFQRPVRRHLAGEVNATRTCAPCPQVDPRNPARVIGNEDCLCLNVYTPKMPESEQGSPVILFIHGGNYRRGSAVSYGGQHLSQKDTILVIPQYRLGSLGYFSTAERDASGNAGLFDMRAALTWIEDYIEFFGGDPSRIVIMGQGSGGSAASLLSLSAEGRSAKGVVALSGTPLSPGAVRPDPAKYAKELASRTGCPPSPAERLALCLRKIPMEKIVQADSTMDMDNVDTKQFISDISGKSGAGARVEGQDDLRALPPLVTDDPAKSLESKQQKSVLLTGVNSAETSRAVFGKYSKFLTEQLATVKDFIKKDLVGGLKDVVQGVNGLIPLQAVSSVLPLDDYYQAMFDNSLNAIDGLSQIAEATADALFNLPAYQTVQSWSGASPAYLYSFEHVGNLSRGAHFLPGDPLADDTNTNKSGEERAVSGPAHGDELAYIFEPLDQDGQPLAQEVSSTDARVRDAFLNIITKFAHEFSPLAKNNQSKKFTDFMPFSSNNQQFIKIGEEVTLDKNFRFCQMGLWGNMADRVTGAFCKDFLGNLLNLPKLPLKLSTPKLPPVVDNLPILPGVLGARKTTRPPSVDQVGRNPTRRPQGGLLGLGPLG